MRKTSFHALLFALMLSSAATGQSIEYEDLTALQQADLSRFLGWVWGDGRPANENDTTGTRYTANHSKYSAVFNRLRSMEVNGQPNPFNFPESGSNKILPEAWDYWINALPGGDPANDQILRDALRNPNFLAGLIDGEGRANHNNPNDRYFIDDHSFGPSHPDETKIYGIRNFGPARMTHLFRLLVETYGFEKTEMHFGGDEYTADQTEEAVAALQLKYETTKEHNEATDDPEAGKGFKVEIIIHKDNFDALRSYGYWAGGSVDNPFFRTPAPDELVTVIPPDDNRPLRNLPLATGPMDFFDRGVTADLRVHLAGPMAADGVMSSNLDLPVDQPFSGAPWNYAGDEKLSGEISTAVDWVYLIIRGTENYKRAAILHEDGRISNPDGTFPLLIPGAPADDYRILIFQRNHLAVKSTARISLTE